MKRNIVFGLLIWSLLIAAPACNAVRPQRLSVATTTVPQADPSFHVDMKKSVEYLASDELEGRLVGTPGLELAADYIAGTFDKLGLQTLPGLDGYFQPFSMVTRTDPDPDRTWVDTRVRMLKLGSDFIPLRASAEKDSEGPVTFVGYGITDRARHYDDYANVDVTGKIVLMMRFEPQDQQGKSRFAGDDWSVDATIEQKVRTAIDHGVVGILLVNAPLHHDDEGLIPFSRRDVLASSVPLVQVTSDVATGLLKYGRQSDLRWLESKIDETGTPLSMSLKDFSIRMSVGIKRTEKQVKNVVGVLPGKGEHADEYVVIGAHYDHLGLGGPNSLTPWIHGIHHGADDNASGTSAMMGLADRFSHLGPQARSLIFIAFTAEEEGLIGSNYFVSHPPVPLNKIVAMLNLDMVGRVRNDQLLIGGEGTAAGFPKLVEQADKGLPLELGEFGKGGIGPSDHTSFALKKIPVLFFFSGMQLDYHRPTDTADKVNYQGMEEVVDFGQRLVQLLTTMPREKYNGSYDARGLAQMAGPTTARANPGGSRASMGAIPDYTQGEDAKGGMRIGGIVPESPADKAGLKQGDVITEFNGVKIDNMMDYTSALGRAKPGQVVTVKVLRDSIPLELKTTLVTRKE